MGSIPYRGFVTAASRVGERIVIGNFDPGSRQGALVVPIRRDWLPTLAR